MRLPSFATIRITLLLAFLVVAGLVSAHQHIYTRNWNQTLNVTVFPLNADGYLATDRYIRRLSDGSFASINSWGEREAKRHDLALAVPFDVKLGEQIKKLPPAFPDNPNTVDVVLWGLRFRWWAFRNTPDDNQGVNRVRMFVMFQEGEDNKPLAHSLGMQKGLMGLVYAYAQPSQTAQNNVVIAHELLHTVGAIDKYENYGNPAFPFGYANPDRRPLYPQRVAEIMAGRIPTSQYTSYMAESLRSVVINDYTASDINWIE